MNDLSDQQLLHDYAEQHRETAFAELVRRHVDLVYSAALRLVRDAHLAEDVTQSVFVALAGNARQLVAHPVLSGWLHCTARNLATKVVRSEVRRRGREQEAATMNDLLAETEASWTTIAPHLDAALGDLNEADRDALMLRYFEKKSAHEMAGMLGISTEAAQRRVSRAVERLRAVFAKRGVTVGAGGLVVVITANAVQAAPAGLAVTISGAAFAGAAIATSSAIAVTKTMAMTTLQKILLSSIFAAAVGSGLYQAQQVAQLREQNRALQQQQASQAKQLRQWQNDRDEASNQLVELQGHNARLDSSPDRNELLKLRGEVGQMRQSLKELPTARAALLKEKLEAMPDKKIPELKFLTEKDWLNAAWNADLDTDDGVRLALSKVRDEAVDTFLALTRTALKKYLAANNNVLPANLLALKPYYDTPVTDDMLQRYAFMQSGKLSSNKSDSVVRKAVYADADYDSNQEMSMSGGGGGSFNRFHDDIHTAMMDYAVTHEGQLPGDWSQINAYLKRSIDPVTIQKYFGQIMAEMAANPPPPEAASLIPALQAYAAANNGQQPKKPSDLIPYVSTPQQKAALQKAIDDNPALK